MGDRPVITFNSLVEQNVAQTEKSLQRALTADERAGLTRFFSEMRAIEAHARSLVSSLRAAGEMAGQVVEWIDLAGAVDGCSGEAIEGARASAASLRGALDALRADWQSVVGDAPTTVATHSKLIN